MQKPLKATILRFKIMSIALPPNFSKITTKTKKQKRQHDNIKTKKVCG